MVPYAAAVSARSAPVPLGRGPLQRHGPDCGRAGPGGGPAPVNYTAAAATRIQVRSTDSECVPLHWHIRAPGRHRAGLRVSAAGQRGPASGIGWAGVRPVGESRTGGPGVWATLRPDNGGPAGL